MHRSECLGVTMGDESDRSKREQATMERPANLEE
jgi:hypothetical protein